MYSSGVLCYRPRASLYLSLGESPYGYLTSRRSPCSSCCSCCCVNYGRSCGHGAAYELGSGTWVFYGLRQSALIRRSSARKVVLAASGNGYDGGWYSECGLDEKVFSGYGTSSLGGRWEGRDGGRRMKVKCMASGEEWGGDRFCRIKNTEAVISLLSEEVGEQSSGWKERNTVLRDRAQIRKKRNERVVHSKERRKNSGTGFCKSERKCKVESTEISGTDRSGTEERERGRAVFSGRGNRGPRREGSRSSSYHSVLSSGDYEYDVEQVNRRDKFSAETSGRYGEHLRKDMERKMEETMEDYEQHEEKEKRGEVIEQRRESERGFVDWDWRKKSEKKLSEFSSNEVESSMESVQDQSTMSRTAGQEDVGPSSSHIQFRGGEQKSSVGVTIDDRTENWPKHKETEVSIAGEPSKTSKEAAELCRFCGSDVKFLSQTERQQQLTRKEDIVVSGALVAERINKRNGEKAITTEREKFVRNPHALSVELDIRGTNSEIKTESSRSYHASLNGSVVEEKQKQRFRMNEVVHREEKSEKSEQLSKYKEFHYPVQRTSLPQPEVTMNSQQELKFASNLTESRIVQSPQRHSEIQTGECSREESSAVINQSLVHTADTRSFSSCQPVSNETTVTNNNFTSVIVLAGEARERDNQTGRSVASIEYQLGQDSEDQLSSPGDIRSENATCQDYLIHRSRAQNTDRRDSAALSLSMLIPPPSQLVQREYFPFGRTNARASQEVYYMHNADTLNTYEGACHASSHDGYDSGQDKYRTDGQSVVLTTDGNALESARRSDEACRRFLGEFMKQTEHATSSDMHVFDAALDGEGIFDGKTGSSEIVSESSQMEARDKRNLSEGHGTKVLSDDIWHDPDMSIEAIPNSESPEGLITSGNTVRRSGGTLWKIIGDLFQLRWGSARSAVRSGGRNSSNVSFSSETWFSGHDADENIDVNAKRGRTNKSPGAAAKQLEPVHTLAGDRVESQLSYQEQPPMVKISPPSMTKHDSVSSSKKAFTWNKDNVRNPPVVAGLLESSSSGPEKGMTASVGITSSSVEGNVCGSGSLHGSNESSHMSVEASAMEGNNVELKHGKKLQRNQQLPRDRFDEWEEVYQLEREQRQIDEMFMREALLEAMKAGDNWEVPVGAVLVQHGKIIARGCNLVEELRDSTAHAEMICIREGSNVLKSWRLAETTLYVTLEPCTMCAGAILQARVDTLVWGAPNKLLGADGSYVRLFPVGEDSRSQATDKLAPPVHPFHPKMTIRRGVLASECADTMHQFFQLRRRKKEKKHEPTTPPSGLTVSHHPWKLPDKMHHIFHMFCL